MELKIPFMSLNLKPCNLPIDGLSWFNLETSRVIKNNKGKICLRYPAIAAGDMGIIAEFIVKFICFKRFVMYKP